MWLTDNAENLIRPNDESCKDVKGEVVLSFFVDKEGNIAQEKGWIRVHPFASFECMPEYKRRSFLSGC